MYLYLKVTLKLLKEIFFQRFIFFAFFLALLCQLVL